MPYGFVRKKLRNPTITVQCEIPPTHLINTQYRQCLCTHGQVYLSMLIQEHNACSYIAQVALANE